MGGQHCEKYLKSHAAGDKTFIKWPRCATHISMSIPKKFRRTVWQQGNISQDIETDRQYKKPQILYIVLCIPFYKTDLI